MTTPYPKKMLKDFGKFDKYGVLTELTIVRSHWARADAPRNGNSMLLNNQDSRCCIGFLCSALGIPDDQLHYSTANSVPRSDLLYMRLIGRRGRTPEWLQKAYDINDDSTITTRDRERKLQKLFGGIGVKVRFVD